MGKTKAASLYPSLWCLGTLAPLRAEGLSPSPSISKSLTLSLTLSHSLLYLPRSSLASFGPLARITALPPDSLTQSDAPRSTFNVQQPPRFPAALFGCRFHPAYGMGNHRSRPADIAASWHIRPSIANANRSCMKQSQHHQQSSTWLTFKSESIPFSQ